ncbi:MAG: single-stranded DNA-binding protein [Acidobacteriota bacterium]|nr:single-stranded DNA-binding protein [Acidobacteriota bacterium]
MSFNKVILIGNIGQSAELRYTPRGIPVANFTVATNEKRRREDGEVENVTTWFRITLWGPLAESTARYLQKGRQVFVEGRLRLQEWQDRNGQSRFSLEVTATDIRLLGSKEQEDMVAVEDYESQGEDADMEGESKEGKEESDIPF